MSLKQYTVEELREELARREVAESMPEPLEYKDFGPLVEMCTGYIDALAAGMQREDDDHYVFEKALECVYGEDIWKWVNERLR